MDYPHAIAWFEIPSIDFERAKKFYEALFQKEMGLMEVPVANGGSMKMALLPCGEGGLTGAVINIPDHKPGTQGPMIYLHGGEDLQGMLDRVEPAGGTLLAPKTKVTDEIGYMAIFLDTEGNHMALHSIR